MKLIKDTIHGYIKLPNEYCHELVDTPVFQRLRRIEQTSVRSVFPCAHHDRFVHSLGTYHLGSMAISSLLENSKEIFDLIKLDEERRMLLKQEFEIACLLHDCGHAPFSHTLEEYFDTANNLIDLLKENMEDPDFSEDVKPRDSKPHEKVSAYLVLTYFKDKIKNINKKIDISLVARMIIGCRYKQKNDPIHQVKNCLIKLLNGDIIDVDKLDYAARDRWASGYNASTVDMERLISSFEISRGNNKGELIFSIRKSAMSEIESLIDSRNFLSMWILNHHKVIYEKHLLSESVKSMFKLINSKDPDSVMKEMFNIETIINRKEINRDVIYQLTDDDIIYLLKKYCRDDSCFNEWLSRKHTLKPLWKSFAEYKELILKDIKIRNENASYVEESTKKAIKKVLQDKPFYVEIIRPKISRIEENDLYVRTANGIIDYWSVSLSRENERSKEVQYMYVYVDQDAIKNKKEIIESIRNELK